MVIGEDGKLEEEFLSSWLTV